MDFVKATDLPSKFFGKIIKLDPIKREKIEPYYKQTMLYKFWRKRAEFRPFFVFSKTAISLIDTYEPQIADIYIKLNLVHHIHHPIIGKYAAAGRT